MNKSYYKVFQFQEKFGHPVAYKPTLLPEERVSERVEYMNEEVEEFLHAKTVHDQADAMVDLMYFALGTMVEMGVEPKEIFDIVHRANMNKLWEDGKPHYDPETNKVLKPEGWEPPEPKIIDEINRQYKVRG